MIVTVIHVGRSLFTANECHASNSLFLKYCKICVYVMIHRLVEVMAHGITWYYGIGVNISTVY